MKNENEIDYKDVIALGFKRSEASDSIFKGQYGYESFLVSIKLHKHIEADWDCVTRKVRIMRIGDVGTILGVINISSLDELKKFMSFFGKYDYTKPSTVKVTYTPAS